MPGKLARAMNFPLSDCSMTKGIARVGVSSRIYFATQPFDRWRVPICTFPIYGTQEKFNFLLR
jgi:hypothetical protein